MLSNKITYMTFFHAIILGIVQGLAEFLPISSSGHLVLLRKILKIQGDFIFFDVMLHIATLFAVFLSLKKDFVCMLKPPFKTIRILFIATLPAIVVVLLLNKFLEELIVSNVFLGLFFLSTALLLFFTEILAKKIKNNKTIGIKTAFMMGVAQSVAIIPGISRSGSTLCAGLACNANKEEAVKFSFYMSVPIILGALVFEVFKIDFSCIIWTNIIAGMICAFVCGVLAIEVMLKIVKKLNLKIFSIYLVFVSVVSFLI